MQPSPLLSLGLMVATTLAQETAPETVIYDSSPDYSYQGCYTETYTLNGTAQLRALPDEVMIKPGPPGGLVVQDCLEFCGGMDFTYAGLEYSRECWCGQYLSALSVKTDDSACDTPCDGNTTQACGGTMLLSVYMKNSASGLSPDMSLKVWSSLVVGGTAILALL